MGEWGPVVPSTPTYHPPGKNYLSDPGLEQEIPNYPHAIRYAANLELTQSKLTSVTPRLGLPVKKLNYKEGDKIILYVGDFHSSCGTPVPLSNSCFLFYDEKQDLLVPDSRSGIDGSHLIGKEPDLDRFHVFYVSVVYGALVFGPEKSLITSKEFFAQVRMNSKLTTPFSFLG